MQERRSLGRRAVEVIEISDDEDGDDDDDDVNVVDVRTVRRVVTYDEVQRVSSPESLAHQKHHNSRSLASEEPATIPLKPAVQNYSAFEESRASSEEWQQWADLLDIDVYDHQYTPDMRSATAADSPQPRALTPARSLSSGDAGAMRLVCVDDVLTLFPDICRDYVSELYDNGVGTTTEILVAYILDQLEKGTQYPKAKDKLQSLKRKRPVDEDEEAATKYGSADRERCSDDYAVITRGILQGEFSTTPMSFIDATLTQSRGHLFPAYRVLEQAERTWDLENPPYNKIKNPRKINPHYREAAAERALASESTTEVLMLALRELQAARRARKNIEGRIRAEKETELAEEQNFRKAEAEGTLQECGCCFGDYPLNRMVHCDNDSVMHWFCKGCARTTAETEIGNSKYEIRCMSMDECKFGFSKDQKDIFLDAKTLIALDRNEQEAVLRMAGIENLASCPFCPFAAEYPPVEEERLFRCQAPDCEKVSCRLCKLESHVPKTCEESAKDNGLSIRRQIEEAMSAALIRKCNKCGTPFVKEEGCNKMTCTRGGCFNIQCYVCSKSCDYNHFDDRSRGGKAGNCPLFDSVQQRHDQEVQKAEREALARVRAEHPEYSEDDLKVKVSDGVKQDEAARRANDPRMAYRGGHGVALLQGRAGGLLQGNGGVIMPGHRGRAAAVPAVIPRVVQALAGPAIGVEGFPHPRHEVQVGIADIERRFGYFPEEIAEWAGALPHVLGEPPAWPPIPVRPPMPVQRLNDAQVAQVERAREAVRGLGGYAARNLMPDPGNPIGDLDGDLMQFMEVHNEHQQARRPDEPVRRIRAPPPPPPIPMRHKAPRR